MSARHRYSFQAMACENTIELFALDRAAADCAAQAAIAEVQRIEAKYSRYRPDSVVSLLNAAGCGVWQAIDTETAQLLAFADSCYRQSEGLFDITSGVLRRVWDFRALQPPSAEAIASVLPMIGWQYVDRRADAICFLRDGMEVDFGGFGKEYAADRAAAVLLTHGVTHGFVDLGGDVVVSGAQEGGQPWTLGIRHPRRVGELAMQCDIASGAVATSGDYERYLEFNEVRYCHILSPKNGRPAHGFQSVTVFAPTCLVAGAMSTIAMLKPADAAQFWLAQSGLRAIAIGGEGRLYHYP
jgi:FAD:protein FMN transferase